MVRRASAASVATAMTTLTGVSRPTPARHPRSRPRALTGGTADVVLVTANLSLSGLPAPTLGMPRLMQDIWRSAHRQPYDRALCRGHASKAGHSVSLHHNRRMQGRTDSSGRRLLPAWTGTRSRALGPAG